MTEVKRDPDGRLRITAPTRRWNHMEGREYEAQTLYTDRPIGIDPSTAKPDGNVYVFAHGAWASPTDKYTPKQARLHAAALLAAADEVERERHRPRSKR